MALNRSNCIIAVTSIFSQLLCRYMIVQVKEWQVDTALGLLYIDKIQNREVVKY